MMPSEHQINNPAEPFLKILDRESASQEAEKYLSFQLVMIRDVVNYGSRLISEALHASDKSLSDIIPICVFLRQVVSSLDAIEVLVASGCVSSCEIHLRAMLESSIYIDFLLLKDRKRKALVYYVANIRREISWCKKAINGSDENREFMRRLGDFAKNMISTVESHTEGSNERLQELEEFLKSSPYKEVSNEFDVYQRKSKKPWDPDWHAIVGFRSLRAIAESVGRSHEYEIVYSSASERMHSSNHSHHVRFNDQQIGIIPIRGMEGVDTLLNHSLSIAFGSYNVIIKKYMRSREEGFAKKYLESWREAFRSMPTVRYED